MLTDLVSMTEGVCSVLVAGLFVGFRFKCTFLLYTFHFIKQSLRVQSTVLVLLISSVYASNNLGFHHPSR